PSGYPSTRPAAASVAIASYAQWSRGTSRNGFAWPNAGTATAQTITVARARASPFLVITVPPHPFVQPGSLLQTQRRKLRVPASDLTRAVSLPVSSPGLGRAGRSSSGRLTPSASRGRGPNAAAPPFRPPTTASGGSNSQRNPESLDSRRPTKILHRLKRFGSRKRSSDATLVRFPNIPYEEGSAVVEQEPPVNGTATDNPDQPAAICQEASSCRFYLEADPERPLRIVGVLRGHGFDPGGPAHLLDPADGVHKFLQAPA